MVTTTTRKVPRGKRRVFYEVLRGDTLWAIARFFRVPLGDLKRWNAIKKWVPPGRVLQLFVARSFNAARALLYDPARVQVVVRSARLARR